jgi:hypothetical protein
MMRRKVRTSDPVQLVCRTGRARTFEGSSDGQFVRSADRWVLYAILTPNRLGEDGGPVLQYDASVCKRRRTLVPSREWLEQHPLKPHQAD